jgi:hypothetical protein
MEKKENFDCMTPDGEKSFWRIEKGGERRMIAMWDCVKVG